MLVVDQFQRAGSSSLDGIPMVIIGRAASNASRECGRPAANEYLRRVATCERCAAYAQIRPRRVGIDGLEALVVV